MRKISILALSALIIVLFIIPAESINVSKLNLIKTNNSDHWSFEYISGVSDIDYERVFGDSSDIAIDSKGYPHIAYKDLIVDDEVEGTPCYLRYAYWNGWEWKYELVHYEKTLDIASISLQIDKNDRPHIVYLYKNDFASNQTYLYYATKINNQWKKELIDYSPNDLNDGLEYTGGFVLDSYGRPHVAYSACRWFESEFWWYGVLLYATKYSSWTIETIDNAYENDNPISMPSAYVDIGVDKYNNVHIVYFAENLNNNFMKYIKKEESTWTAPDIVAYNTGDASIAVDSLGQPHIAAIENYNWLVYYKKSGEGWKKERVDHEEGSEKYLSNPRIALDSNNNPYIVYSFYSRWDGLAYLRCAIKKGSWNIEIPIPIEIDNWYGEEPRIEIDKYNVPHISAGSHRFNVGVIYCNKLPGPDKPQKPQGPNVGSPGVHYTFTTKSTTSQSSKIQYGWDWNGDYRVDEWSDWKNPGEPASATKSWESEGKYAIRVVAKTQNCGLSEWSDPFIITISKSRATVRIPLAKILINILQKL